MSKIKMLLGLLALSVTLTGCVYKSNTESLEIKLIESTKAQPNQTTDISIELEEYCKDIYEYSRINSTLGSLETIQNMVNRLSKEGYAVIDQNNQVNMENPEQVEEFCKKANENQNAELLLIMVLNNGGFVQFNFNSNEGKIDILAQSLSWKENRLINIDTDNYEAYTWTYSENGYLFFEKYYMAGFSGPYSHVAVRVKPLDTTCRELNRNYILPINYDSNNLFTIDWNENDYQNLNFYDLFEKIYPGYPLDFSTYDLYSSDSGGDIFQVPKENFEEVIMSYFNISSQVLQEKTTYIDNTNTYEYRPRGIYDCGSGTESPYPEVINYKYNDNGTITLTVNAVWPEENLETAFKHTVVIRPLSNGTFQYVSNQVIPSPDNVEPIWYVDRLTEENWQNYYQ